MAIFFKKGATRDNRIENAGRWPVRLTNFYLADDYEFPPSQYTEIFLVREGTFLHETEIGTQALRQGAIMVNHPSNRHTFKQPEDVKVTRVRFLQEWLARDYQTIVESPDVLSLFCAQSWFQYPTDTTLHVFNLRDETRPFIESDFDNFEQILRDNRQLEPISRVSLLKLMLLIADDYCHYWRGGNRLDLRPEVMTALDFIENGIGTGEQVKLKDLEPATGMSQDHLGRLFRKATGVTLVDYSQRRRIHHAALKLLTTADTARDISAELGFTDSAHFSKSFQKYFNVSPNVYRQKFGQSANDANGGRGDEPKAD